MMYILSLVILTVGSAVLLVRWREQKVINTYKRFEFWRKLIGTFLFGLVAWTFLRSGRVELILAALILIWLVTMYVIVDKPNETLT